MRARLRTPSRSSRRLIAVAVVASVVVAWCVVRWALGSLRPGAHAPLIVMPSLLPTCDELERDYVLAQSNTTIVTAYFNLSLVDRRHFSKHDPTALMNWATSFVSLTSNMIIFTDSPELINLRRKLAPDARTHIVQIKLKHFEPFKTHLSKIKALHARDTEAKINSAALYALYYSKVEMLWWAAQVNPWNTAKFLWMDIGSIRTEDTKLAALGQVFPLPPKDRLIGPNSTVTFFSVAGDFYAPDYICAGMTWLYSTNLSRVRMRTFPDPRVLERFLLPSAREGVPRSTFMVGGCFGGPVDAIQHFRDVYNAQVDAYLAVDQPRYNFADQAIFTTLACKYPELVQVVKPVIEETRRADCDFHFRRQSKKHDPWFFYLRYFA